MAGQTAGDDRGECLFPGDMAAQIEQTIKNIEKILDQGGMDFTNVMRLNVYTTDMGLMLQAHDHMVQLLQKRGCQHVGTLLGISALASPGALVEMEVTAAK
jgi:enamine deaminase RidA (YjgF/YER057c/UK114 family)